MEALRPALVLDADLRQSLLTIRSLGRAGVRVFAAETQRGAPAFSSRWCSGHTILPDVARDADAFVEAVIELADSIGSPVIITSHDGAIEALRARRPEVEQVAALALAEERALAAAIDKEATLAVAQRLGIPVPAGRIVQDLSEARDAIETVGLPVVIKPLMSWIASDSGARRGGARLAPTHAAALEAIQSMVTHGVGALLQPWLGGSRDAISLLLADDLVWMRFAMRSHRSSPMIGGSAILRETIPVPADAGPMAEALVRELSLQGYAEVEFRRDREGTPFLMEINPRLNAGMEVAVRAGVDAPELLYRWAAGYPLRQALQYTSGKRMRYLHADVEWVKEALRHPEHPDAPAPMAAVGTFLTDFLRPTGYDYWDWGDPAPALLIASRVVRGLPGRLSTRLRRVRNRRAVSGVAA